MSRSTIRVLVSLLISLVVIAAVFVSVQAASRNAAPAALGAYIVNDTFRAKPVAKQESFKTYSNSYIHGDFDCGYWAIDPDD
jgi:hypothetical protein